MTNKAKELGLEPAMCRRDGFQMDNEYFLTKREYFAAMAMQGIISSGKGLSRQNIEYAVKLADVLPEELSK